MHNVTIINHALVQNALAHLRKKTTKTDEFRQFTHIASRILLSEASFDLPLGTTSIQTPLTRTIGPILTAPIVIVPVLRAGISMLPDALTLFPQASVGFAGLKRDEATAIAHEYYWNMPPLTEETVLLLLDPMLATGGSILTVLQKLSGKNIRDIRLVSFIAAPEGIKAVHDEFPDVTIYTGVVDTALDPQKFIVPGLGDFGDRYFGTD